MASHSPKQKKIDLPEHDVEEETSLFLRSESSPVDSSDPKSDAVAAIAAAAAAIQNSEDTAVDVSETPVEHQDQWPIDRTVSETEYAQLPSALRTMLSECSQYPNGLTKITRLETCAFQSREKAIKYVHTFADAEGFHTKFNEIESSFSCHMYAQNANGKRVRPGSPCPFQARIEKDGDVFAVVVDNGEHNHGPDPGLTPSKRRRYTHFQKTLQVDLSIPAKPASTGEIMDQRWRISEEQKVRGENIVKGLVGALRFDNALLEEKLDDEQGVSHLFWTTTECMHMLEKFPEVLFINFISPSERGITGTLVHIQGITGLNSIFEVGYGLIRTPGLSDFRWVLFRLQDIAARHLGKEYTPSAVITYRETMLMAAVDNVFPETNQICVSQVMREVYSKSALAFGMDDAEDRKKFLKRFKQLIDSETPEIYSHVETDFKKMYASTKVLELVQYQWLIYKTKFVRGWVDQHKHFNNYSMGKAEPVQAAVEDIVQNSGGDLLRVHYQLSAIQRQQQKAYAEAVHEEKTRCPVKFFVPFYEAVRFKVSSYALEMIKEQRERYLELESSGETHRCTGIFTAVTGLPCKHTLSRPVQMSDVNRHWWLDQPSRRTENQLLSHTRLSERDRHALELNQKFDRAMGLVKEHFLNYSSLDSREFMLASMLAFFEKSGISMDSVNVSSSPSADDDGTGTTEDGKQHLDSGSVSESALVSAAAAAAAASHNGPGGQEHGRKCGKCNQVGHNSRTCGQRLWLQRV